MDNHNISYIYHYLFVVCWREKQLLLILTKASCSQCEFPIDEWTQHTNQYINA